MAKVTLSDLSKVFKDDKKPSDFHYYGQIVSVDSENRTYEVSINRDESITVEAARLVGAGAGDTVMVTVMANGYATVTGRVGGDMDASDAQRTADAASTAASNALSQARSAAGTASQAQNKAVEALGIANNAVELAEQAEEEAGRASTAAEQAAASASSAEADAARAATSAQNAEADASSASTSAQNAAASASSASTSASNAATSAQNAASDAASAATSASNAEADASSAATSAQNASASAQSAASDASSASSSATAAAADAATARQQSSAATTAANEAKTQAQAAETAANEAKADASSAKRDAAAANTAANGAVAGLAVVQGGVDQLETDVDDMQTHVAMMNAIDEGDVHIPAGLHVVPSASGYFMVIANDGVYVYDNESVLVAKYGHNIVYDSNREHKIGNNTSYIRYYDSNNDGVADAIEIVADNIRLGSYSVGDKITATETTLNNYMSSNNTRVGNVETSVTTTTTNLTNYITSNNQAIENLQGQIDGSIQTWFYAVDPTLNNPPAMDWDTTAKKEAHLRDLYFNTTNGHSFRFAITDNTTTPPTYGWVQIVDADAIQALADAAKAQDTADHKRRVFVTTPAPPYEIGDLWVQGQNGDIFRCATPKTSQQSYDAADWVKASKYTDDTKANAVESDLHTNYYVKSDFSVEPDKIASTISATETTVKTYADGKANAAESNAKTYADGKASTAETNAKTYADNNFDSKGSAASALDDAKDYADDNFDSKGSASAAQAAAISAAAADATTKANAAESNAKTAAATDATNKANAAKQEAIADAATKYYTKTQTYTKSEIEQKAGEISLGVAKTEIEKIDVGGRNLALNSKKLDIAAGMTNRYVSKHPHGDPITIEGNEFAVVQANSNWQGLQISMNQINQKADDEFCFSSEMYVSGGTAHIQFFLFFLMCYNSSGTRVYPTTFTINGTTGVTSAILRRDAAFTEPEKVSCTFSLGSEGVDLIANGGRISATFQISGVTNGASVYMYAPKLEKGNKATAWTPAPEDLENYTDTKITEAKAEIKVTTDAIESTVSNKVGNNEVISKINQSAESVKIQANKVEIDGTATFNAIKSQADAAYDSKDSASTAETNAKTYADGLADDLEDQIPTNVSELNNDSGFQNSSQVGAAISAATSDMATNTGVSNTYAAKTAAVAEEQYIYKSAVSGTNTMSGTTTWVSDATGAQNTWTTKRPQYNSSYPVLFVAKQKKTVSGAVTCTTPVKDDTTTVIDGGHITTGTIDASVVTVNNLDASKITTGTLSADYIETNGLYINSTHVDDLDDLLDAKQDAGDYITDSDFDERISDIAAAVNTLNGQILFGDDGTNTFILLQNHVKDNPESVTGVQAKLTSGKLAFGTFGSVDNEVAYFSSEELKVQKRLSFGNFVMKQRDNGHLSIMFEGGDD